jgi:hypothetical protein
LLGALESPADPHPAPTGTLRFVFPDIAPGDYRVRLRVSGVDSHLINQAARPPAFIGSQMVTVT